MDNTALSRQKRLLARRKAQGYIRFHLWATEADYAQIKALLSQRTLGQNVTERSAQLVHEWVADVKDDVKDDVKGDGNVDVKDDSKRQRLREKGIMMPLEAENLILKFRNEGYSYSQISTAMAQCGYVGVVSGKPYKRQVIREAIQRARESLQE